jgi:hypothetical protein
MTHVLAGPLYLLVLYMYQILEKNLSKYVKMNSVKTGLALCPSTKPVSLTKDKGDTHSQH